MKRRYAIALVMGLVIVGAVALAGELWSSPMSHAYKVLTASNTANTQAIRTAPPNFQGRMLVSISDADMVASAYVNQELGVREGQDALSLIALGGNVRQTQAIEVAGVSNSVAGPPSAITISPDGRWAFVVESFRPAIPAMRLFRELEQGTRLMAIDLSNPRHPRLHAQLNIGTRPETVEMNAKGDMLLVTLHPVDGRQLAFVAWSNGQFGKPSYTTLPQVGKEVRVSHVVWHPSGDYVAGALVDQGQVLFARVIRRDNSVALEPWGKRILVGKYPFKIMFTRDGQYLLTTNLQWGPDVNEFWTEAPRGSISAVRFAMESGQKGQPQHFLVSVAETGVSPEGIAISPDGMLVATTNLERSYLPYDDQRITWFSSLTLMQFDSKTGHLETLGDFLYDGILPEALTFDRSGQYLAVATYDHFDRSRKGGSIDFWRVVRNDWTHPTPRLVQTNDSVAVTRGVHSLVLVP
jgi:DNA-binding beta-propeller fold protein YncE